MINVFGELVDAIVQAVQEVFNEVQVQPPNCIEDDLAELEPIEPDEVI
jgi:hypothetical protein